ncbi:MAG: SDR family NAD(P)-dependent oxidoreductase, partial [Planctomycetota bacterium]
MSEKVADKDSPRSLALITPIIRGLLAEPTGEPDMPYAPVILKSVTSREAVDFAGSEENAEAQCYPVPLRKGQKPPLFSETVDIDGPAEELRGQLSKAISDYSSRHNSKPEIVCFRDAGVLYVERKDDDGTANLPLRGKVALVTGAAGAIGYGICCGLLENGCHLAATDLPGEKLDSFVADLKQIAGDRVMGAAIDVTSKESVLGGFESVIRTWGGIDILVVNAGIPLVAYLKDMDIDAFRTLERVNVEGALLTLQEIANHFILQDTGGDIIIVSTKNVPCPGAGFGAYSATKAACHQLGRIASIELAQ